MLPPLVVLTVYALSAFRQASAARTNITIDDTNSTYWTFVGSYHAVTPSTPCIGCGDNPDPGLVYNNSWHDGALRSGSFVFQGTAVYIYGIDVTNPANVTFAMNNPTVNSFHWYSGNGYFYNSLFFSATNLDASVQHTVTWLMETSTFGGQSALFDYAIVTVDQADASSSPTSSNSQSSSASNTGSAPLTSSPSSTPSASPDSTVPTIRKKSNTGAIAGAVVGVVAGLALLGALVLFLRRRRSTTAGDLNGAQNYYGSDAASRGTSGAMGYTIEPYPPPVLPSRPFVNSQGSDSRSMSATSMAPVSNMTRSTRGATGYTIEPFQPPIASPRSVVHSEDSESRSMSAASMAAARPAPVSTGSASSKVPLAPVVLAWDPNDPSGQRARDLEIQERLRNLEQLVAASQPPVYS